MYFHRINTPEDEQELLKEIIDLDTRVRKEKERARLRDISRKATYEKIFDPITRKMEEVAERTPAPTGDLISFDEIKTESVSPRRTPDQELYDHILSSIPPKQRDTDGLLGLDSENNLIGGRSYTVNDNILSVEKEDGTNISIPIQDPDVWKILLLRNPKSQTNKMAVEKYRNIVKQLGLLEGVKRKKIKNRNKYRLLAKGDGFLFTTTPPPSTIFVPSQPKRLIRSLIQALAELRAGNEARRNTVVQFAKAAKAKNILPPNLLTKEETTWMYS